MFIKTLGQRLNYEARIVQIKMNKNIHIILLSRVVDRMAHIKPSFWEFLEWEDLGDYILLLSPIVILLYLPLFLYRLFIETIKCLKNNLTSN